MKLNKGDLIMVQANPSIFYSNLRVYKILNVSLPSLMGWVNLNLKVVIPGKPFNDNLKIYADCKLCLKWIKKVPKLKAILMEA